ncbi:alpha-galactosidase [Paenibacillus sp. J5C_2022]|uniref:alpha-galactosidase n=1 Tax=Paenibacillus sp. J5C2022 TaxID=2977129 RepID=UPI0021D27EF0|nr:alpha-galactosidase [Paenibacillus sp. J5C2022]MCU6708385.1 alpha-galactosidase [Paenibacillus sp. J5C2022]
MERHVHRNFSKSLTVESALVSVQCHESVYRHQDAQFEFSDQGGCIWKWESVLVLSEKERDGAVGIILKNSGGTAISLQRVCLEWPASFFVPSLDARDYTQLYHSRDFTSLSGVRPVHRPNDWSDPSDPSAMATVLSNRLDGTAILLGALPPYGDCFVDIPLVHEQPHCDGRFGIAVHLQSPRQVAPGERIELAHVTLMEGNDGNELLKAYGAMMRNRLHPSFQFKEKVSGWNSWDYYAGAVTEQDVKEHAAYSRKRYGDLLRYIVIDEGYECQWGVWEAGWKFQSGLSSICREIRASGYEPGIWTAPLMVNVYTPLFRERPEWFVGDASGNVYLVNMGYGSMAQLDITRPDVVRHIETEFSRLRQAGFTYFKCDFTQLLLGASSFSKNDITHSGMIRKLFTVIRQAIGEDAYLLACGAPYEAVVGIADAHRTTGDIHHYWSQIRQNVRSMFARWWMQGAIGNTDPDFAIVRCDDTSDDPHRSRRLPLKPWKAGANWNNGREMDLEEAKTLLLACLVTGGDLVLGDALPLLNEEGHMLLEKLLNTPVDAGMPLNMFDRDGDDLPIVLAKLKEGGEAEKYLLAAFNLSDDPRELRLPAACPEGDCWSDFWTDQPAQPPAASDLILPPHSTRAWLFIPRSLKKSISS